jgi:hypothetical protein
MNTKERTYLRPKRRKTRRLGPFLSPLPNLLLLVRLGGVWTHCGGHGTRRCGGRGRGRGGRGCRCGCMYRNTHHVSPVTAIDADEQRSSLYAVNDYFSIFIARSYTRTHADTREVRIQP